MIDWLELYLKCLSYAQSPRVVSVSGYQAERSKTETVSCPVTAVTRWPPTLARVLPILITIIFRILLRGLCFYTKMYLVLESNNDSKLKMSNTIKPMQHALVIHHSKQYWHITMRFCHNSYACTLRYLLYPLICKVI